MAGKAYKNSSNLNSDHGSRSARTHLARFNKRLKSRVMLAFLTKLAAGDGET
jgi:hypothetical protein